MSETSHPTLLSSCALAATAKEAQFRVPYPNSSVRASRIFALDQRAADAMMAITEQPWQGAHFLTVRTDVDPDKTAASDLPLEKPDGSPADLAEEVDGANVVVLISSSGRNAGAAEVIAREAFARNIMSAGLVLNEDGDGTKSSPVVNTLRPFTSVLVIATDQDFIPAMLTALRA